MYRKRGRFETNYQIDLFCAVCVFILLHFVLLEKITFRFIGPPHFVLPDLLSDESGVVFTDYIAGGAYNTSLPSDLKGTYELLMNDGEYIYTCTLVIE